MTPSLTNTHNCRFPTKTEKAEVLENTAPKIVDERKYYGPAVVDFRGIKQQMKRRKHKSERKSEAMPVEAVEAPARIRPEHVQDRTLWVAAGSPKAYRTVDWPIQIAHEKGRLRAYPGDPDAELRWQAIRAYDAHVDMLSPRGRDSTDLDIVKGGSGFPITEAIADAVKKLVSIDSLMPRKDRTICRKLCAGHSLPGAVRAACGDDFVHTVAARVRDALDALIQAMHGAKRAGYTFDLRSL